MRRNHPADLPVAIARRAGLLLLPLSIACGPLTSYRDWLSPEGTIVEDRAADGVRFVVVRSDALYRKYRCVLGSQWSCQLMYSVDRATNVCAGTPLASCEPLRRDPDLAKYVSP